MKCAAAGVALLATAASPEKSKAQIADLEKPDWSVSLKPQGYRRSSPREGIQTFIGDVAATEKSIAVLLCTQSPDADGHHWTGPVTIFLLLYEAQTGKFLAKKGPWQSGYTFGLVTTPTGQLLLVLSSSTPGRSALPQHFLLLSRVGELTEELELNPDAGKPPPKSRRVFISPNGATALLVDSWPSEIRYRLVDSESVAIRKDWTEPKENHSFEVASISNTWMLGKRFGDHHRAFATRRFDSEWRELPKFVSGAGALFALGSSAFGKGFVVDDLIAETAFERKNEIVLPVYDTEGNLIREFTAPKPGYHSSPLNSTLLSSMDGNYIGVQCWGENALSYWWDTKMDMWPVDATNFLYVWSKNSASALARIKVGPGLSKVSFFQSGEAKVAVTDQSELKVFSLPRGTSTN